ncbi:Histone acetyltransferase (MYST family) [Trachipleistophora hominis]|uniref:histone acetyltransferase n=1 Tax=Trachipleistophora hominis TaxID=72359 RepID=L7JZE7_TRAHO|nr:Histone acetyltransferase (MYST family) [Trachipleistophora hominis]
MRTIGQITSKNGLCKDVTGSVHPLIKRKNNMRSALVTMEENRTASEQKGNEPDSITNENGKFENEKGVNEIHTTKRYKTGDQDGNATDKMEAKNEKKHAISNESTIKENDSHKKCNFCGKILRKIFVKCLKCEKKFHNSCSKKGSRIVEKYDISFICNDCNMCTECGLNNGESAVRCLVCPRIFHKACTTAQFCRPCREKLYMGAAHPEAMAKFEMNMFNSLVRSNGFMKEEKGQRYMNTEIIVNKLYIGNKKLSPRYLSPFINVSHVMYVCEKCFFYFKDSVSLERHRLKCDRYLRGNLVYSHGKLKLYEIDGEIDTIFCRNLCLVAKCFLDHKTLYYDVEPFLFYTLYDDDSNFIGYFSREKFSTKFNLSCIVVLPCYQGKGFGYFLIDFSYCLCRIYKRKGTPEKPLSDQGLAVYKKYWKYKVYNYLSRIKGSLSIEAISDELAMTHSDVVYALELLEFLKKADGKYYIEVTERLFVELKTCDPAGIITSNIRVFDE